MSDRVQSNDVERGSGGGGLGSKIANMFNPSASLPSADTNKVDAMANESILAKYEDSKGPMGAWARWHLSANKKLTAGWVSCCVLFNMVGRQSRQLYQGNLQLVSLRACNNSTTAKTAHYRSPAVG